MTFVEAVQLLEMPGAAVPVDREGLLSPRSRWLERTRTAAERATDVAVREPRPAGFPLLFTRHWQLIEPTCCMNHGPTRPYRRHSEDLRRRSSTTGSRRWASSIRLGERQRRRPRGLSEPHDGAAEPHRPPVPDDDHQSSRSWRTPVLRVGSSDAMVKRLAAGGQDAATSGSASPTTQTRYRPMNAASSSFGSTRSCRGCSISEQARELLAELAPPYDLMARWQLYTGYASANCCASASAT